MHTINIITITLPLHIIHFSIVDAMRTFASTHHMYIYFFDKIVQETVKEKLKRNTI